MAKPIFVIGKTRSGTKWLSNIIAKHPEVACVQGEDYTGILESNLFYQFPQIFGDLRHDENYCAMAACFSKTSYFQTMELDEKVLFAKKIDDYHEFFRHVMDAYSEKEGKSHWLQKSNPLVLSQLHAAFPDAQFVIINRDIVDNIRSSVTLARRNGDKEPSIISEVALYQFGRKIYEQFKGKRNVLFITYEELKEDRETSVKRICEFVHLDFVGEMLEDDFRKNTSFKNESSRSEALSRFDEYCIAILGPCFRFVPLSLLRVSRMMFGRHRDRHQRRFVSASFLMLRKQHGWPEED